jgi:hypothetical protein
MTIPPKSTRRLSGRPRKYGNVVFVIPANAGSSVVRRRPSKDWIPALAGMTLTFSSRGFRSLNDHRDSLTASDAGRAQAVTLSGSA